MKVLHVIGTLHPSYGGPAIACPELCEALVRRGHDVELFVTERSPDRDGSVADVVDRYGLKVTCFPIQFPGEYGLSVPLAKALWSRVEDFDVVHIHSLYRFHSAATALVCQRRSVPYIVSPHGSLDAYHWLQKRWKKAPYEFVVERRNLDRARVIHVTSSHERDGVEKLGVRASARVVPYGVRRPDGWDSMSEHGRAVRDQGAVVFIGRLAVKKRIDILIAAFAILAAGDPTVSLLIAGPDEAGLEEELRSQAVRLNLSDRVRFLGAVYGEEKWKLLAEASMFVLPSEDESFGIAVAEAMAAGVPVIVSEGVALHGAIADAHAGLVVDRSADAVAEAMRRLLADQDLATSLGRRGQELADRLFGWDSVGGQMESLLAEAMDPVRS